MVANANRSVRLGAMLLVLALIFAALSCGGSGGGTVDLAVRSGGSGGSASDAQKGTAVLITEDEIATLPLWQQELLSDPGWNQPYIEPRAKTQIEAPTAELLIEDYQRVMEAGLRYGLHGQTSGKGASYVDQQGYVPPTSVLKGEYDLSPRNADPPYGCNTDGANGSGDHAFDDVIREGSQHQPQSVSFVLEATTAVNWFNTTGGAGNDAQSAVYQLFATSREAVPAEWVDPENTAEFEELCYRSDLAPGVAPGGDCSDAEAYLVDGLFWKRFNSVTNALPNLMETELFNLLVAPASAASSLETNANDVAGRYQEFYFGTVGECYGSAWIVGLESADSGCDIFDDSVNGAFGAEDPYHYTPVYGVILKRWQQTALAGMAGPWESWLGWPVWGPKAYANGAQMLTPRGAYYAWGVWFERGFMWWIDYDQTAYPNTPDEAQVFNWTGSNVFCYNEAGSLYQELAPTVYYGGGGTLGVSVVVDSYRYDGADPWVPVDMDATGTYYEIALPEVEANPSGTGTVNVALHAHGYGGTPYDDCSYDWYVWAFRDGTIQMGDEDTAQYVNHTYGNTLRNMEQVYIVRVQVRDADMELGYGDSLPIHLGHGGGGGGSGPAEVWLIRDDGETYGTNYDALTADLDALGASWGAHDYADDIADQFDADGSALVAIWYRGGPGNSSEPQTYTTGWTDDEIDNYIQLLEDNHPVLMMSQASGYQKGAYFPSSYACGWEVWWGYMVQSAQLQYAQARHCWAHSMTGGKGIGGTGLYGYLASEPFGLDIIGAIGGKGPSDGYDMDGINCAERYNGAGSSGDIPITYSFGSDLQVCGLGFYSPFMKFHPYPVAATGFEGGVNNSPPMEGLYDISFVSWGSTAAPNRNMSTYDQTVYINTSDHGNCRVWVVGYPWAVTTIPSSANGGMTREMLLQNMLGWLDDSLTYSGGGGAGGGEAQAGAFSDYIGNPEIIQMMVGNWEAGNFHRQSISMTWDGTAGNFPDQNANPGYDVNVYRTTDPGDNYVVTSSPNNDWVNGNDVDFQFPWYAYIVDVGMDGVQIGTASISVKRSSNPQGVVMNVETRGSGAARNVAWAELGTIESQRHGNLLRLLRERSESFDEDGKSLGLMQIDHVAARATCGPPDGSDAKQVAFDLPEQERITNVPLNLLFLPLVQGQVDQIEFQLFLCRGGPRVLDFAANIKGERPPPGTDFRIVEIEYKPELGPVLSVLARGFVPNLSFWFDANGSGTYLAHRMPLFSKGPEVTIVRDGLSPSILDIVP